MTQNMRAASLLLVEYSLDREEDQGYTQDQDDHSDQGHAVGCHRFDLCLTQPAPAGKQDAAHDDQDQVIDLLVEIREQVFIAGQLQIDLQSALNDIGQGIRDYLRDLGISLRGPSACRRSAQRGSVPGRAAP